MKKGLVWVVVIGGILVVVAAAVFFSIGFWLSPQSPLSQADAIVAISGGDTQARTQMAVQLYQDGWSKHLIFSGAALDPNSPSNASVMAGLAEQAGVPVDAIEIEPNSTNTQENAADVDKIITKDNYHSIILVTSPYHQRRASIVFRKALGSGIAIINHSSIDPDWRRSRWWASDYSRSLTLSELQKTVYEIIVGPQP
jgi:uncharacterized SAM-binding protein YcdF (DUF218 family)